jgi:hypothetical protein
MLRDEIIRGVELVSGEAGLRSEEVDLVSDAIVSEAVSDATGRRALALNRRSGGLVFFDLFKAITAAAGVLGATIAAVAGPITLPAVLSAVAALGSLQGLRQPLPRACAQVVALLLERRDRGMAREELLRRFKAVYDAPPGELETDLERALDGLMKVKSIRVERGTVRLVERIVIRF